MSARRIRRIAVIGGGLMGHGIAQELAVAGYQVALSSRTEESLERAMDRIRTSLGILAGLGLIDPRRAAEASKRIRTTTELAEACEGAQLAVEAVYEDLDLKREIFGALDTSCPEDAILASTTSTFMPSQYAPATTRPDRVIGAHYFNPPHLIPLVELIRGPETSDETLEAVDGLLRRLGKKPVLVKREKLGFIGNRLQAALLREALWLVQEGVATARDVDTVISSSIGRRWAVAGVFEIFDLGGWDVVQAAATHIVADLQNSAELPPVLREKVEAGELGVKTGKGFYEWTPESARAAQERLMRGLLEMREGVEKDEDEDDDEERG